jgi:Fe-S cluster assembly ATP-binding protein
MLKLTGVCVNAADELGNIEILRDINLTLDDKKIYVMTGPTAAANRRSPRRSWHLQDVGRKIELDGVDITDMNITERARLGIGYAFSRQPASRASR